MSAPQHYTKRGKTGARLGALLTVALLVLTACQPHPTPTTTSSEVATTPHLGAPSATAIPPTPTPTITLTPTPTLTPSPTPVGMVGPYWYPENVNPLTGLAIANPSVLDRRPLAIKVSNYPPEVRPHTGLSYADLVYEHYTEGDMTRLTAIYYGQTPVEVGSVRSGRLIDLELVPMYDAIFVSSGYSDGVAELMHTQPWVERNISISFGYGEPFLYRAPQEGLALTHALFSDPSAIWTMADEHGFNQRPDLTPGLAFYREIPSGGTPATGVELQYPRTSVYWWYNPGYETYWRWQDGEPHEDVLANAQITARNVVVIYAQHVDTDIIEDSTWGTASVEIQIWGEGPLTLFRDGQLFQGLWHREDREEGFTFANLAGDVLPLRPGNTWFQVVPLDFGGLTIEP